MTMMRRSSAILASCFVLAACSSGRTTDKGRGSAVEHGRALFDDRRASPNASNAFSCGTCHRAEKTFARIDPGGALGGVTSRRSFWAGQRVDLLEAINDCRTFFMDAPRPWTVEDEDARATYAFLAQLPPSPSDRIPFTLVPAADLPRGDPKRGSSAYALACKGCHGTLHEGVGRLTTFIPLLPDEVIKEHAAIAAPGSPALRLVFVSKIRGGAFRSGGSMPPFSREALADEDVAGILALFALY